MTFVAWCAVAGALLVGFAAGIYVSALALCAMQAGAVLLIKKTKDK